MWKIRQPSEEEFEIYSFQACIETLVDSILEERVNELTNQSVVLELLRDDVNENGIKQERQD